MKRVGLFGGSFDPVHNAHVALARLALEQLQLDEVRWIPVGQPWQKSRQLSDGADREAMVRLAIAGEPRFVVDRIELRRRGVSYTLDTVRELAAAEPGTEWVLILGQDQYASLHTWRDWRELRRHGDAGDRQPARRANRRSTPRSPRCRTRWSACR